VLDQSHSDTLFKIDRTIRKIKRTHERSQRPVYLLWAGDFNWHSPLWDEERNHHLFTCTNIRKAQTLINRLAIYNLKMLLPQGIPMLQAMATKNYTCTDNVFILDELMDTCDRCTTLTHHRPPKTDHLPVVWDLDLVIERKTVKQRLDWLDTDWEEFNEKLRERLNVILYPEDICSVEEFHNILGGMQGAIQDTIKQCVSRKKIMPYTKQWWSEELAGLRAVAHRLGKCSYCRRTCIDDPIHEEYRWARNRYTCSIKIAKDKCWEEWLKSVNDFNMWRANLYISTSSTDRTRARVPTLVTKGPDGWEMSTTTNDEKTAIFETEFFPIAPAQSQIDKDEHEEEYPKPAFDFEPITDERIRDTIAKLAPYKAPDTNEFSNSVLMYCADQIVPHIEPLFRAVHTLRYWPEEWKFIGTIVLQKPGKDDYLKPGSHRPILLSRS
jgi:hypothetical protein